MEQALLENRIGRFAICEQKADCFEYWIAGLYRGGAVPEGLKLYCFPESDWAVFSARGPLPGSLQTLNTYIWQTWYPAEGQQVVGNGAAALEVYSAGDMQSPDYACGIWVPIVRLQQTADDSAETAAAAALLGAFISDGAVGSVAGMPAVRHAFYQGRQGLYAADPGPLPAGPAGRDQLYV